jgi:monoamine oxidase
VELGRERLAQLFVADLTVVPAQRPHREPPRAQGPALDYLPRGGFAQALRLGDLPVQFDWPVEEIEQSHTDVVLRGPRGEMRGETVILTLPLGILQQGRVHFQPPLSVPKLEAIRAMRTFVQNKCVLLFPQVFWPTDRDTMMIFRYPRPREAPLQTYVELSHVYQRPVLVALAREEEAELWESQPEAVTLESVLAPLRGAFGAAYRDPSDHRLTHWGGDPWSRGALSFLPWPESPTRFEDLAKPEGRLFFAGEATHERYCGTVHGAYLSGQRAASEAARLISP